MTRICGNSSYSNFMVGVSYKSLSLRHLCHLLRIRAMSGEVACLAHMRVAAKVRLGTVSGWGWRREALPDLTHSRPSTFVRLSWNNPERMGRRCAAPVAGISVALSTETLT